MFVVSRTSVLATNILRYLALSEGLLATCADMAEALCVPLPYLRKVTHRLIRAGLVEGVRGTGGGARLARPPSSIRLGDVMQLIDRARIGNENPGPAGEQLTGVLDDAKRKFLGVLNEHTIADLCIGPRGTRDAIKSGEFAEMASTNLTTLA